jgi:hypothetical protein
MSSERIEIFEKASHSLKISFKWHAFLKNASHSQKRASRQLPNCHNGQSTPADDDFWTENRTTK